MTRADPTTGIHPTGPGVLSAEPTTGAPPRALHSVLLRYVPAAVLARMSDAGALIGVVLLVTHAGGSGFRAGALAACLTAPHLLGPFVAGTLDRAPDGRRVIAAACAGYAVLLAAATLLLPVAPVALVALLLVGAGTCGPLLTGGISSQLVSLIRADQATQRRAQGWDVATYGIGGSSGPALVATCAAVAGPTTALPVLAGCTLTAVGLVLALPCPEADSGGHRSPVPSPVTTLVSIWRSVQLRRTLLLTIAVALAVAALPVAAVRSATELELTAPSAALLVTCYGLGNLFGALLLIVRPLRGVPDALTGRLALAVAAGLLAALTAPALGLLVAAYLGTGLLNALFFASTLAARTEYAPAAARNQIFIWVAALKITAGSAGTALAGTLSDRGYHAAVGTAVLLASLAGTAATLHRRRTVGSNLWMTPTCPPHPGSVR
ncbi:hypothetical protein [Modestobacter sp. URMC 112]